MNITKEQEELLDKINHDCTFLVGTEYRMVTTGNKAALSTASPVLKAMIESERHRTPQGHVDLGLFHPKIFELISCFAYLHLIPLCDSITIPYLLLLMVYARYLAMPRLWYLCEERVASLVSMHNVLLLMQIFYLGQSEMIEAKLIEVFCANADLLFEDDLFLCVSSNILRQIVQRDDLNVTSEVQVIEACVKWSRNLLQTYRRPVTSANVRVILLENFMDHFRFLSLRPEEFARGFSQTDWLTDTEKLNLMERITNPKGYDQRSVIRGSVITRMRSEVPTIETQILFVRGNVQYNEMYSVYRHALQFNSDVKLHRLSCHSQVFHPCKNYKNDESFVHGNEFEENLSVIVSKEEIIPVSLQDTVDRIERSKIQMHFMQTNVFASTVHFQFTFKVKREEVLYLYIICRKNGYYPMNQVIDVVNINHLKVTVVHPNEHFNRPSPLASITVLCPIDKQVLS